QYTPNEEKYDIIGSETFKEQNENNLDDMAIKITPNTIIEADESIWSKLVKRQYLEKRKTDHDLTFNEKE
ncbi:2621_t:CDS:2, partial [Gigaspora margarita]